MDKLKFDTPFLTDKQCREAINYLLDNIGSGGGGGSPSAVTSLPNSYTLWEDFLNGGVGSGPTERTLSISGAVLQNTYTSTANAVERDPVTVIGAVNFNIIGASSTAGYSIFRVHPNQQALLYSMLDKGFIAEFRFYVGANLTNPTNRTINFGWYTDNVTGATQFDSNGVQLGFSGILINGSEVYVADREQNGTMGNKTKVADLTPDVPYILTVDTRGNDCVYTLSTGLPDNRTTVVTNTQLKWKGFAAANGNTMYPFRIGAAAGDRVTFGATLFHSGPSPQLPETTRMAGIDSFFLHVPKLR